LFSERPDQMQTKHRIQELLASAGIEPNKRLGQNFLIDLNLMRLLIDTAHIGENDVVLEVGCGTGSLTQALAELAGRVIAVETDDRLAKIAAEEVKAGNVEVISADILENKSTINRTVSDAVESARKKLSGRFLLISNLPYNIASSLMMDLITGPTAADAMYVTVQKEVAERMTAEPGDRHYGTLSIHMAATGEVKTERQLKPTVFWPQPQVHSAMVSFVREPEKVSRIKSMELLGDVVNLFMQHRRKMVQACTKFAAGRLAEITNWPEIFRQCGIDPHNRPEQLTPEDYIAVANLCLENKR
jgi:16S rRNA (adenine1518-N6/adenine1519-N6)-dimethyltransferase